MAKIQAGILSPPIGKVAGVVGFKWKDKACLRGYVVPKYSNTDLQKTQRALFALVASYASAFLGQVLQPYMDKFIRGMSGYNDCIQYNIASLGMEDPAWDLTKIARGVLFPPQTVAFEPNLLRDTLTWTWTDELGSNGKLTDPVIAVAYCSETGLAYFSVEEATRAAKTVELTVPSPETGLVWKTYLFCAQYNKLILDRVSDSVFVQEIG
jgi:hypothetical protein